MTNHFDVELIQQLFNEIQVTYAIDVIHYEILKYIEDFNKVLLIYDSKAQPYIVKLHFDQYVTSNTLTTQHFFKNKVQETGLLVPKHMLTITGDYYGKFKNHYYHVETFIGNQIRPCKVNYYSMGYWLAKLHLLSVKCHLSLKTGTQWQVFGENKTNTLLDYNHMEEMYYFVYRMYPELKPLVQRHMTQLHSIWHQLPRGITHGDYAVYNIIFNESGDVTGLYDFDLIGQDAFINELAHSVLLNSFYTEMLGFTSQDGFSNYHLFIKGYLSVRPLTLLEKEAFLILMKLDFIGHFFKEIPILIIMDLLEGKYDSKIILNLYDESE
jgi:Ser/Thr protein kinase RdoA (MazF antagonist)